MKIKSLELKQRLSKFRKYCTHEIQHLICYVWPKKTSTTNPTICDIMGVLHNFLTNFQPRHRPFMMIWLRDNIKIISKQPIMFPFSGAAVPFCKCLLSSLESAGNHILVELHRHQTPGSSPFGLYYVRTHLCRTAYQDETDQDHFLPHLALQLLCWWLSSQTWATTRARRWRLCKPINRHTTWSCFGPRGPVRGELGFQDLVVFWITLSEMDVAA